MKTHFFFFLFVFFTPSVLTAQRTDIGQLESQYLAASTSEQVTALTKAYQDQAQWDFLSKNAYAVAEEYFSEQSAAIQIQLAVSCI